MALPAPLLGQVRRDLDRRRDEPANGFQMATTTSTRAPSPRRPSTPWPPAGTASPPTARKAARTRNGNRIAPTSTATPTTTTGRRPDHASRPPPTSSRRRRRRLRPPVRVALGRHPEGVPLPGREGLHAACRSRRPWSTWCPRPTSVASRPTITPGGCAISRYQLQSGASRSGTLDEFRAWSTPATRGRGHHRRRGDQPHDRTSKQLDDLHGHGRRALPKYQYPYPAAELLRSQRLPQLHRRLPPAGGEISNYRRPPPGTALRAQRPVRSEHRRGRRPDGPSAATCRAC